MLQLFEDQLISSISFNQGEILRWIERIHVKRFQWVEIQCTMVLLGQAEPMQIFLPFVYDMKKNETFYQKVLSGKPTLLLG